MLHITWLRRLAWGLAVCLGLGALAWSALPPLLKSQAEQRGSDALGRRLSIGTLDFKPWTLELGASEIRVASADGQSTQLSIARIQAKLELQSLWRLAPVLDGLTVMQPQLALTHLGAGHTDLEDVLARFHTAPESPPSAPMHFVLNNLAIRDGSADVVDHLASGERHHSLRKLQASLPFFSRLDSQREQMVQPHLAFELNGSAFDSAAQVTPFATSPKGELNLQVTHLDIAPYLPYLPASLPLRLRSALLDGALTLSFEQAQPTKLLITGTVKLSDLRLDDPAGAKALSAASVQAVFKELRPLEHSVVLESLELNKPTVAVGRNAAGVWMLPGVAQSGKSTPASADWQVAVQRIQLHDGQLRWSDDSVAPKARLAFTNTQVQVRDLRWPLAQPAHFEASATLQTEDAKGVKTAKGSKPATLQLTGEGTDTAGSVTAKLSDLGLSLAAPYLSQVLLPQASGVLEGELAASWNGGALQLQAKRLALHDFALSPPAAKSDKSVGDIAARDLPSFKLLEARDISVDLQKRSATLGRLALLSPHLRVSRGQDGQWLAAKWFALGSAAPPKAPAPAWSVALTELAVDDGALSWVDRAASKPVFLELSALQTRLKNLTLDGRKPIPVSLLAKVRGARTDTGSLRFDGTLSWDPLVAQGRLEAKQFPAQSLAPYAMGKLRLDLLRADTSFKGDIRYASLPNGPELQLRGDGAIEELVLNAAPTAVPGAKANSADSAVSLTEAASTAATAEAVTSEELLHWKALSVPAIAFNMAPGTPLRLQLGELSLSDFFARLVVNAQGRLVLQDLVHSEDAAASPSTTATPLQAGAAAPVVDSASGPVIDIGGVRLVNGRVAFSDHFIKPNYSADLTELAGAFGHFGSAQAGEQMANLELRGRAEGTASLEIAGKLNPLARPPALEIKAKVRDLELSPLSSYAIKYAGYGIERGKLSADLSYAISPDGMLQAGNQITLNQLVFGDAEQGTASPLPVKLAVALLADSRGVIDLNLPVSGSLNDPQFRVWPLIWKVVGNIVAKALTSPFSLIRGLLGGEGAVDELSNVVFDAGTARVAAAGLQGLDSVAQALRDKPGLRLTVVGTASLEREADAIRRERLQGLLLAEKRRAAATSGKDVTAVDYVTPQESPALLKEVYRRSGVKKPRNLLGLVKDLSAAEMQALLLASMAVDEDTVRELALNRSIAVRDYLTARQLPSERLFLGDVKTDAPAADWQPRAELSIEHH